MRYRGEGGAGGEVPSRDPYLLGSFFEASNQLLVAGLSGVADRDSAWSREGTSPPAPPVNQPKRYSRNLLTTGRRQSLPNARGVILMPMAPWRRLYSFRSTIAMTRFTVVASKPRATMSATPRSFST